MKKYLKPKTIVIKATEWFDKTYGNSYFSARVFIDGELKFFLPFQYGYGEHYIDMAFEVLIKNKVLKYVKKRPLWKYCKDNNIELVTCKRETLKRDMYKA